MSIGYAWRATMMANSARDPYWHAAVRREVMDHPTAAAAIEDTCSTCHMPMARFEAARSGESGAVFASLDPAAARHAEALDGVSCSVCHQIDAANFGETHSFDGGFSIDAAPSGNRPAFGPYAVDAGHQSVMHSAAQFVPSESPHVQRSELCATCHTLYTQALNERGEPIGELPEQVPYQEWRHSEYRNSRSCQDCHMPEVAGSVPISSVLGEPRPRVSRHTFHGGNSFMLSVLGKYRNELGVRALPQELDAAVRETRRYLGTEAATVTIESAVRRGSSLDVDVAIASTTGHKLPTAYPSRRAWLHFVVRDSTGAVVFESGAVREDGSIVGNDNDADGASFEPHHRELRSADEVQIYESIMVDTAGRPTTGLLSAVRYAKDNRLLPRGFDKRTAPEDVAVHGAASDDPDFVAGGDRVRYRVQLTATVRGPLHVSAELLYQSIGYRWAANLAPYDAPETRRFGDYYRSTIDGAAVTIGSAAVEIE